MRAITAIRQATVAHRNAALCGRQQTRHFLPPMTSTASRPGRATMGGPACAWVC
jgi:hypothetical protein